jgi:hypothetical protein
MKVKLKNKTEVTIDLYALSVAEVRELVDVKKKDHEGDDILGKAVGMSVAEIQALPFPDYRKVTRAFWKCVRDPFIDGDDDEKNLPSESTLA